MLEMEELVLGFPNAEPGTIDCRFGTTVVFDPYPIPPHFHVIGLLIHSLNRLPRESGLIAAQLLRDISDEVEIGPQNVLETVEALESAFACEVADRSWEAVQDAPRFPIELSGRLLWDGADRWMGLRVKDRGLPSRRRGRDAFLLASLGGVYAGALRHTCQSVLVQDRMKSTLNRLDVDLEPPAPTPQTAYAEAVAKLLSLAVGVTAYLYVKDERGFPNHRLTFKTAAAAARDEYQQVLAMRPA